MCQIILNADAFDDLSLEQKNEKRISLLKNLEEARLAKLYCCCLTIPCEHEKTVSALVDILFILECKINGLGIKMI